MDEQIKSVANSILDISNLDSDRFEEHTICSSMIKLALEEAYRAGFRAAASTGY